MSKRPPKPVYVLHGQDPYLRHRYRSQVLQHLLGPAPVESAVAGFDAAAGLSEVLDELRTTPFLAPRRVAIVRDADKFVTRYRQELEEYLAGPCPTGSLILAVSTWPARTRLAKLAAQIGEVFDCSPPAEAQMPRWIARAAGDRRKRISPDAVQLLAAWIGPDLSRLDSEIEKLALYVGSREEISNEDVAAVVVASAGAEPFALPNALGVGDVKKALEALSDMLTSRDEEVRTLGLIRWHLRRSLEGKPVRPPRGHRGPVKRRSIAALHRDFRSLLRADLALKSGAAPLTTLQMLLARLCES